MCIKLSLWGRGSLVVKEMDSLPVCYEFVPSIAGDLPCREALHFKSVESLNLLPLVWCGSWVRRFQRNCRFGRLDHGSTLRGPPPNALE
ncbi:hypothetical protein TNCV_1884541 [Trichonephila clavipes]|nr:hypothetical protein TNCV_1884541 [Trichonephila clavipes]